MKTYRSEWEELKDWRNKKSREIFENNPVQGFDGEGTRLDHELHLEFMEKWRELKKKYNIEQN